MDQEKIGKFIANLRKEKNLTQKEFAETLGVTDKTVSRWENGHYLPDISLFNDICSILNIDVTELLKGEKIKEMNQKEVNHITMNLVNISNQKIKKNKKKIIIISSILILLIITIFITLLINQNKKTSHRVKPNTEVSFPQKVAFIEKEDGWVCSFKIEYLKGSAIPYYYGYDCDNFKYNELQEFIPKGQEYDEGGIFTYTAGTNHPSYGYNKEYRKDLIAINSFFEDKKFTTTITKDDLADLKLEYINKEEVLNLYNHAIASETIYRYGNYPNITETYLTTSMQKNGYTWYLGFLSARGHIKYIYLDVKIENNYLSDLMKQNQATEEQLEIYNNIEQIKEEIIKSQNFKLSEELNSTHPYTFLNDNFSKINNVELGREHY